jgi:hypothetical protein
VTIDRQHHPSGFAGLLVTPLSSTIMLLMDLCHRLLASECRQQGYCSIDQNAYLDFQNTERSMDVSTYTNRVTLLVRLLGSWSLSFFPINPS